MTYLHSPEERNPHAYESLNGKTEGIRQLGISQTGWEDNIKMDLKEAGCDMHRIHLAHDKDRWWALANRLNASQERLSSLVHSIKLSHVATPVQFMTPSRSQYTQKRRASNGIRTWKS
jgi:hypothetical protein